MLSTSASAFTAWRSDEAWAHMLLGGKQRTQHHKDTRRRKQTKQKQKQNMPDCIVNNNSTIYRQWVLYYKPQAHENWRLSVRRHFHPVCGDQNCSTGVLHRKADLLQLFCSVQNHVFLTGSGTMSGHFSWIQNHVFFIGRRTFSSCLCGDILPNHNVLLTLTNWYLCLNLTRA